jgi:CRP/FNR family transcriptional regulator
MENPNRGLTAYFCQEDDMSSVEKYLHLSQKKLYKKGERIFKVGEKISHLYYLKSGKAGRLLSTSNGAEKYVKVVCDESILGEVIFFKQIEVTAGEFVAIEDCECYLFDENTVYKVLLKDEKIIRDLIQWFCNRMSALSYQVSDSLVKDPHYRICKFLYDYVLEFGVRNNQNQYEFNGKLSHYDISKYLGINRVSVTNVMKELQEEGIIIKERNKLIVLDMAYLEEV